MSGLPYLESDELQVLFGYRSKQTMYNAINRKTFPVATYHLCGRVVADREVVMQFFLRKRKEGMEKL